MRAAQPPTRERIRRWNATQLTLATRVFLVLNLAVFVYLVVRDPNVLGGSRATRAQVDLGLHRFFIANGEWWRMITSGFIHFGIIHLAFNSIALWNLGATLEREVGPLKFAAMYVASLLAGSAGVLVMGADGLTGGASGAVFGLFGAVAVLLWRRGINPLQTSIGTVLILNLVLTFTIPQISIGGHLGGLAGGALCGAVLGSTRRQRPVPEWVQWAVPVAVAAVSVVVGFAVSG